MEHEARIDQNAPEAFAAYFEQLGEPSEVVIEACWNWGVLYDLLEQTDGVSKVVLSHPAKNRIIADAQIKNDRIDAKALATLLRGNLVSTVHVPSRDVRTKKNVVRQRLWLARLRTMIRNRIHTVIDRHPQLERPVVNDIFCKQGIAWMKRAPLPDSERALLDEDLELHRLLQAQIDALEKRIATDHADGQRTGTSPPNDPRHGQDPRSGDRAGNRPHRPVQRLGHSARMPVWSPPRIPLAARSRTTGCCPSATAG